MIHKKIKVIAKIENNTQNLFFINMLYSLIDSRYGPETVENIEDNRLLDNIIDLSYMTIKRFPNHICFRNSIIMYDSQNENYYYNGYKMDDRLYTKIIIGTSPKKNFGQINYLIQMMSKTIEENNMGEFKVQYKDRIMTKEQFYEFQKELLAV